MSVLSLTVFAGGGWFASASRGAAFEKEILPILETYCYDCHADGVEKGGVAFDTFGSHEKLTQDLDLWSRTLSQLQFENMPPPNKKQPGPTTRRKLLDWIERDVFKVDCNNPDPGRVTIRRLNRTEYNNTIRDLLGIDFRPADDFPADDAGFGFDNIGDVLSISPLHLEKYLAAAGQALDKVISPGPIKPLAPRIDWSELRGGQGVNGARILVSSGEIETTHRFPVSGDYQFTVRAFGDQAGGEPVRMGFAVDGESYGEAKVPAKRGAPGSYQKTIKVDKGMRHLAVSFLNDYYQPKGPPGQRGDRNLIVESFTIVGPVSQEAPEPSPMHERIFFKKHTAENQRDVAREIVAAFARRAFRRPVRDDEVNRLMKLWDLAFKRGDSFELSVKLALQAALSSPAFLFRGELQPEPDNPKRTYPIDEHALASRLSYFLWSSMPDEELSRLADQKRLRSNLAEQVYRMLRSSRSTALADEFALQWLQVRNLELVEPSKKDFPEYDDKLKEAMRIETEMLFKRIVREDRSALEFLTADYTHLNGRLAKHYGIPGVEGDEFRRVSLKNTPRRGLLTHGSVLTITSNPTRTSPVKRGLWVVENILGTPPPPPPPNVPELEAQEALTGATLRERLIQHRENPMCKSCHTRLDPLGFGLENFDAIGRWRDSDGGAPIDAAGVLVTGETFGTAMELADVLMTSKRDEFVHALASKMLTYALGRGVEHYDKCAIDQIVREMERNEFRFSSLVLGVVKSVPFQLRRGEGMR